MAVAEKKKPRMEPGVVPKISKVERQAEAEKTIANFLDAMHKGQKLPPEMEKELLSQALDIYNEAQERSEKRFQSAEDDGRLFTSGEKVGIWQNECKRTMLERIEKLMDPIAQKRVDQIIASLPEKDKKALEKNRDNYVNQMRRQLALNPKFLKEKSGAATQKSEVLAMIHNIEGQMKALDKQLKDLKKTVE